MYYYFVSLLCTLSSLLQMQGVQPVWLLPHALNPNCVFGGGEKSKHSPIACHCSAIHCIALRRDALHFIASSGWCQGVVRMWRLTITTRSTQHLSQRHTHKHPHTQNMQCPMRSKTGRPSQWGKCQLLVYTPTCKSK